MITQRIKNNNRFIIAVILIICAHVMSIIWQKSIALGDNVGYIDLFIYGSTYGNIMMDVFAPLLAILTIEFPIRLEMEGQVGRQRNALFYRPIKAGIKAGLTFVVGLVILFVFLLIYNTSPPKVQLNTLGSFTVILNNSKILYVIAFIVHSFLYGFVFAILGYGLALNTKNKFIFYFAPILINQLSLYTPYLFPPSILREVLFFTPQLPYDVLTNQNTILGNIKDLALIITSGVVLILTYYTKNMKRKVKQYEKQEKQ